MPNRHRLAAQRKKPIKKHSLSERARLRKMKKKIGPCGMRRKERRLHLQPKPPELLTTPTS